MVSVSITSYNQRDALIRAIESVLSQTYKNIQVVIADDYSTKDDSRDVIWDYQKKYGEQIKPIFQTENVGIPRNKNSGFRACDGDYITYLDGDDFYYPEKIAQEIRTFETKPWANIVYSNFTRTDLTGNVLKAWAEQDSEMPEGNVFKYVYARQFPWKTLYRCELMRKEVLPSINYYDPNIAAFHDWDSRIRMTKRYKVAYSNYIGSAYVDDPAGISRTEKRVRLFEEMQSVHQKNLHLLNDEPKDIQNFVHTKLNYFFSKQRFAVYPNQKTVKNAISHFKNYPLDLIDIKFLAHFLLGSQFIKRIKK